MLPAIIILYCVSRAWFQIIHENWGFFIEDKPIQNSRTILIKQVTIISFWDTTATKWKPSVIGMESLATSFKQMKIWESAAIKRELGSIDEAKGKLGKAKRNWQSIFGKLSGENMPTVNSTCTLMVPIITDTELADNLGTLTSKQAKLGAVWAPSDLNVERGEQIKDFITTYKLLAESYYQQSKEMIILWENLQNNRISADLIIQMEQLDCVGDSIFDKTSFLNCQIYSTGLRCEILVHVIQELDQYTLLRPIVFDYICLGSYDETRQLVKTDQGKIVWLKCAERIKENNELCNEESLPYYCETGINEKDPQLILSSCPFTTKCPTGGITLMKDFGILIDGGAEMKIFEDNHQVAQTKPFLIYSNSELRIVKQNATVTIPPISTHLRPRIVTPPLSSTQLNFLKVKVNGQLFLNLFDGVDFLNMSLMLGVVAILSLILFICLCKRAQIPKPIPRVRSTTRESTVTVRQESSRAGLSLELYNVRDQRKRNFQEAQRMLQENF